MSRKSLVERAIEQLEAEIAPKAKKPQPITARQPMEINRG